MDLAHELAVNVGKFTSAAGINQFLSKLLLLLSQDRIAPRRAAVLAYTCNLLLRSLPAIERERNPESDKNQDIGPVIWDMPGPDRERQ
ncbi:MAG: hypothetical protein WBF06_12275 [Candidatus Acidiferrales bacterium]